MLFIYLKKMCSSKKSFNRNKFNKNSTSRYVFRIINKIKIQPLCFMNFNVEIYSDVHVSKEGGVETETSRTEKK